MNDQQSDRGSTQANKILSLCWNAGTATASYFDVDHMEIYAIQQASDPRPQYAVVRNLIRQFNPMFYLVSGPKEFMDDVHEIFDLADGVILRNVNSGRISIEEKARFCDFGPKAFKASAAKVLALNLPGIPPAASEAERRLFMESVLPFNQDLLIHAVGCLLILMDNLVSEMDGGLMVSKINVVHPKTQLIIDELSFQALQIFDSRLHPSGFKRSIENSACSLFNLFNRCSSKIGKIELKCIMHQPTRDLTELNRRFNTIEWLVDSRNIGRADEMRGFISNLTKIQPLYRKIVSKKAKNSEWKSLKKNIYYVYLLCKLCCVVREPSIDGTPIADLAELVSRPQKTLKQLLFTLDEVVDLIGGEKDNKFTVKVGIDQDLDINRRQLCEAQTALWETSRIEFEHLPIDANDVFVTFLPGYGFVFSATRQGDHQSLSGSSMNLVYQSDTTIYFQNNMCQELNNTFGDLLAAVSEREQLILGRLIAYIDQTIPELILNFKVVAKLDVLLAFASVASSQDFKRPFVCDQKILTIKHGRHPLLEQIKPYRTNDTELSVGSECYVKILTSIEPSGKTIYLKEIAMICYLAHIGSFVPAQSATIGLLDSLYSRLDFPESIYSGKSSFMGELYQMSNILSNTTSRSLVLIDEFGKGTTYSEGKSLLISSLEYLLAKGSEVPMTIVATQFTAIAQYFQGVPLLRVYATQTDTSSMSNQLQISSTADHHYQELITSAIQSLTLTLLKKFLDSGRTDPTMVVQLYRSIPLTQAPARPN